MQHFGHVKKERPASMGGLLPIPPLKIIEYVDRLRLPCSHDEAIEVLGAMDDVFCEMHSKEK